MNPVAWRYFSVLMVLMLALGTGSIALIQGPVMADNPEQQSVSRCSQGGASTVAQGAAPIANITVQSASLSPTRVKPRSAVYVTADVVNTGTADGSARIKLYVNDTVATDQGITLRSGGRTTITFNVSCVEPGNYSVFVDNVPAGIFTVDPFADTNVVLYLVGSLIFFALVGAMVFAVSRSPRHR
ncbi:MAG: CARDB domain-containing protein [Dehalococcoidia bacterium]